MLPGPLIAPVKLNVSERLNDSVEVDVVTNTLPAPAFPVVPPLPMTRLPSLITAFPVNVLLTVRTQLPLSFLASVVPQVPASPIVPATVRSDARRVVIQGCRSLRPRVWL